MMDTPPPAPKPHVLVVPFPAQGHMLPLLDLAALLATRAGGELAVTVAVTAGSAPLLDPLLAACPSVGVVTLPFPSSPPALLPPGFSGETTSDLPLHLCRMFIPSLAALRPPLALWCETQAQRRRRVTAVVSDLFTGWTRPLAAELGARHVTFSPTSASYVTLSRLLWRDMPQQRRRVVAADAGEDDDDEEEEEEEEAAVKLFPDDVLGGGGVPRFPWHQLPWLYRQHEIGDEPSEMIRQILLWSLGSEHVVVNSFAALEPTCYLELEDRRRRVLAVGPLSEARATSSGDRGVKPAVAPSEVTAWLDNFADGSVVYVNFGTQHALSPEQAARVAEALARSSPPAAAFVWAAGALTAVPAGFEAATAAQGMVIRGWAPQVEILRHRAVGWFLTHCGTNAVLEAVAAGVAVLTWPMGADHFVNRALLRDAGVAVHVAEGADAVPDAGEMARAIAVAVAGDEGKAVRERAVELGRKAAAAVAEGGSSYVDFQELVDLLAQVDH